MGDPSIASSAAEAPKPARSRADWVVLALATGLGLGLVPPRTATLSTLLGIPLAIGLYHVIGWWAYLPVLAALFLVGIPICDRAARLLGKSDPREVTYDEVVTLPIVYFLAPELSPRVLIAGFVLHRIFDIVKPLGIRASQRLGGGLGIMIDDLLAALLALGVMGILYATGALP